jgi:hypothetical protein
MKPLRSAVLILLLATLVVTGSSCRLWRNMFQPKYGCPSNGKNVGAEKIISGDPEAMKAVKKAKKFRS